MLLGANLGNAGPAAVNAYEKWLGRRLDFVQVHTGRKDWQDYVGSVAYCGHLVQAVRPIHWSIPLFIVGGSLADAAGGAYDGYWRSAMQAALPYSSDGAPIYLRSGWEFNYSGQPWFSGGREALFVQAVRRFVGIMRSVSPRFRFVWCPNVHIEGQNPELSYPGDDFIDVVSMDFYVWKGFDGPPEEAWKYYRFASGGYGLQWMVNFARSHGKPPAVDEWGVMFNGYESFIALAADFFRDNEFLYAAYWEETSDYDAKLSAGHYPSTGREFVKQFGRR
jgi:hypothetical protein